MAKNTTGQKITKWAIFDDENKQEFQLPLTSVYTKDEDKETDRSIWSSHGEERMKMADITETNAGTTLVTETLTDKPRVELHEQQEEKMKRRKEVNSLQNVKCFQTWMSR